MKIQKSETGNNCKFVKTNGDTRESSSCGSGNQRETETHKKEMVKDDKEL